MQADSEKAQTETIVALRRELDRALKTSGAEEAHLFLAQQYLSPFLARKLQAELELNMAIANATVVYGGIFAHDVMRIISHRKISAS
jgi:hypothetical protein